MIKVGLFLSVHPGLEDSWSYLPPLGLGYLSSFAKQNVEGVEVILERDLEALIAARPDLVGISFATHTARLAARQARRVKEALGCPVLCGGPHVSTLPTMLDPVFDAAILSEGEETFAELLRLFQAEKQFTPQALRKVQGLLFHDEAGALVRTEARPYIQNLDTIPYPDRDLMFEKWRRERVEVQIMTSRGCPYNCSFCSTIVHWGRKYRSASDEYILGELELVRRKYNPAAIHFYDDLFTVNRARVLSLTKKMRARRLHEGVEYTAFVRSNLLDDELMEALAATNFKILNVGFESGSDAVLKVFNKLGVDMDTHMKAVDLARRHGMLFTSCFILGAPGETRQDIMDTFDFVRVNTDVFYCIHFSPLMVFPGTEVWEWARAQGLSETNLTGVTLDTEDFEDGMGFLERRWPYFNEQNIPREEMLTYLRLGTMMEDMVGRLYEANRRAVSPGFVAENVPIMDIVREKTRNRFRKLLPTGRW